MDTSSQQLWTSTHALKSPVSYTSFGIENLVTDNSVYQQSLMFLRNFPALELGSDESLSQQSDMILPNLQALELGFDEPLSQQSDMILPSLQALVDDIAREYADYGMRVDDWSVGYSEAKMLEGFISSDRSLSQQSLTVLPNVPAVEYAGEYADHGIQVDNGSVNPSELDLAEGFIGSSCSLSEHSLTLHPNVSAVEYAGEYADYGMRADDWSVGYSEAEMLEGFISSDRSLSQQSLTVPPNVPAVEYAGEYADHGIQVDNGTVNPSELEMVEGFISSDCSLSQESVTLLPNVPGVEYADEFANYGIQVDSTSVDHSESKMMEGLIGSDSSLSQQSLMLLPNDPAVEYAGEFTDNGKQVDKRSVDFVKLETLAGFIATSHRKDVIQENLGLKALWDTLPTIKQGIVDGSIDRNYLKSIIFRYLMGIDDTLPSIKQGIHDHEEAHEFEQEELGSPSHCSSSVSHKAEDRYNTTEFRSSLEEAPVEQWRSEAVGGYISPSSVADEGESLTNLPADTFQVRDVMGCTKNIPSNAITAGEPGQAEDCETSPEIKFSFNEMLEFDTGSVPVASKTEFWEMVWEELQMIVLAIAGKSFYQKTEQAGSSVFLRLKSSLPTILHELKEKGLAVTLKVVRREACKWVYKFMTDSDQKVAAHPEHIKEIPRKWLAEHGNSYPSENQYSKIAEEMGLEMKKVTNLFVNARKRTFRNVSGLDANLKSHFSPEITGILRKWQTDNGGKQPDPQSRQQLMDQTNCSKDQIVDWFNNHKPGRDRSKKKTRTE